MIKTIKIDIFIQLETLVKNESEKCFSFLNLCLLSQINCLVEMFAAVQRYRQKVQ